MRPGWLLVLSFLPSLAGLLFGCGSAGQEERGEDGGARDVSVEPDASTEDAPRNVADATGNADATDAMGLPPEAGAPCPVGMIPIEAFCVDRYEDYVVEIDSQENEQPHSPFDVIGDAGVRAKTLGGVIPQGYISQVEATAACAAAGKRLCSEDEFALACRGPDAGNDYPYGGDVREPGDCNEGKGSSMPMFFGPDPSMWTYADFNDPRLNQWEGGLAPTGSFPKCVSPFGTYDCVGNLHEWGSDSADSEGHGRFRGGFYGDAEENGPGCLYVTSAHDLTYHDYSTGFRCCADARGADAG